MQKIALMLQVHNALFDIAAMQRVHGVAPHGAADEGAGQLGAIGLSDPVPWADNPVQQITIIGEQQKILSALK